LANELNIGLDIKPQRNIPDAFSPSWVNRITDLVGRIPIPFWLFYLISWLLLNVIVALLRWGEGVNPPGTIAAYDLVLNGTGVFFIALMHYLDKWVREKLPAYRWALNVSDEEFQKLLYQITKLPSGPSLLISLAALSFAILALLFAPSSFGFLKLNLSTISGSVMMGIFLFSWCAFGAICYHAVRQLSVGSYISTTYLRISVFQLDPVYSFAGLALRTAVGWLFVAYAWAMITPGLLEHAVILVTVIFMQIVAIVTFIVPLLGAHSILKKKKAQLKNDIGQRLSTVITSLQQSLDMPEKTDIARLNSMLASLVTAEQRIEKIPTWPWRPDAIRGLATAIVLPIAIWLFQIVVQRFFLR
jgi:hypothetical protein